MSIHSSIDWEWYPLSMSYEQIKQFRKEKEMTKKYLLNINNFPPTPYQFRMMDECVVHVTVKWAGVTRIKGNAKIYHIENDDTAYGKILTDEIDDNVNFVGALGGIFRTTIDGIVEVPDESYPVPTDEDYQLLKKKYDAVSKLSTSLAEENKKLTERNKKVSQLMVDIKNDISYYLGDE